MPSIRTAFVTHIGLPPCRYSDTVVTFHGNQRARAVSVWKVKERALLFACLTVAGCHRPAPPWGVPSPNEPPTFDVDTHVVAQFSSDGDTTLTLLEDCTWMLEAEEAPHLGKGRYQVVDGGERIILDRHWSLMPWHGGHRRAWEDPDVLYDETGASWRRERRRPGIALPPDCQAPRP